jgi:hypothetical protein
MPTEQQGKRQAEPKKQDRERLDCVIGKHVLHAVGQPGDLHRVQVRRLWEDHYRVNVLVGPDAASARVANSYFLVVDGDGAIVTSTPRLTRLYGSATEVASAG